MSEIIGVALVVFMNVFVWRVIYCTQQNLKELGVTDYTNKAFYEPSINLMAMSSILSLAWIIGG